MTISTLPSKESPPSDGMYRGAKRAMDIAAVVFLAIPVTVAVAAASLAILLYGAGPVIFRQPRVGRRGKTFICYKLRTMEVGTPEAASHEISIRQVTRVGRVLRRLKIDELPQLWNVFRGDMSLVGPRPCLPSQVELTRLREELGVLRVRPGITGLAQVRGVDMSEPQRLSQLDAEYVRTASLFLDIRLLASTVAGRGRGDSVGA